MTKQGEEQKAKGKKRKRDRDRNEKEHENKINDKTIKEKKKKGPKASRVSEESRLTQSYICVILLKMTGRKAALLLFSVSLLIKSVHTPVTKNETSTLFRRRSNNQRDKLTLRRC